MSSATEITNDDVSAVLQQLLVQFGDSELRRTDEHGLQVYDKHQPLVFAPTGRRYSFTEGQFNYHAANFVFNTAYKLGYEVPVYPTFTESAISAQSYNNTAETFIALS